MLDRRIPAATREADRRAAVAAAESLRARGLRVNRRTIARAAGLGINRARFALENPAGTAVAAVGLCYECGRTSSTLVCSRCDPPRALTGAPQVVRHVFDGEPIPRPSDDYLARARCPEARP